METGIYGEHTEPPKPSPWGFWVTIGFSLLILLGALAAQVVVGIVWVVVAIARGQKVDPDALESNGLLLAIASCATAPVVIGLVLLFAGLRKNITIPEYLGFRRPRVLQYVAWGLVCALLLVVTETLNFALERPVPEFMVTAYTTAYFLPLLWLAVIVGAPLCEEIVFRGFLFRGVQDSWLGPVGAMVLSSVAWSAMHIQYDLYEISSIFVLGLVLGAARVSSKSIYVPIAMHAAWNLTATIQIAYHVRALPS